MNQPHIFTIHPYQVKTRTPEEEQQQRAWLEAWKATLPINPETHAQELEHFYSNT